MKRHQLYKHYSNGLILETLGRYERAMAEEPSPMAQNEQGSSPDPQINLLKGGGAIHRIRERFTANAATGSEYADGYPRLDKRRRALARHLPKTTS